MNFDKFIDDGEGLIIHPPPKEDVDKAEDPEDLEKYNQCHGYRGRFCSSGGGSGGGAASPSGPRDESPEERSAREAYEEAVRDEYSYFDSDTGESGMMNYDERHTPISAEAQAAFEREVAARQAEQIAAADKWRAEEAAREAQRLTVNAPTLKPQIINEAGATPAEMKFVKDCVDREQHRMKITGLEGVVVKPLDGDAAHVWIDRVEQYKDRKLVVTRMEVDPAALKFSGYQGSRQSIAEGKLPWLTDGYAHNDLAARASTITHESAHIKLAEYVGKKTDNEISILAGMDGGPKWSGIVESAASKGWAGPSLYGQKNMAEAFAESTVKVILHGTSGNKEVDSFVNEVLKA